MLSIPQNAGHAKRSKRLLEPKSPRKNKRSNGSRISSKNIRFAPPTTAMSSGNTPKPAMGRRGGMVAKVIDLDQVDLEIAVLETYIPQITIGADATVEVTAMSDRRFMGKVREINPLADQRTRNFTVRIRLENNLGPTKCQSSRGCSVARRSRSAN